MSDAAKPTEVSRPKVLWTFVGACLLVDFAMPLAIEWIDFSSFDKEILALLFVAGVLTGQACFVTVVAGMTRRTWVGGYLLGIALAGAGYVAVFTGFRFVNEFSPEMLAGAALVPLFLLATASPLYLLRQWFGWQVCSVKDTSSARRSMSLADIFSQVAIVSAALVMARVPQVVLENDLDDHWVPVVITSIVLFCTCAVVLPLHIRISLGSYRLRTKLVWLALVPLIMFSIFFGIIQCFSWNQSWNQRLELVPFELTFLGAATVVFYSSLFALYASGLRLVRIVGSSNAKNEHTDSNDKRLHRLTWWRIGGAIAVTTATSIGLANLEVWRQRRDVENAQLTEWAEALNGHVGIDERIPTTLILRAKATDQDLRKFRVCSRLDYLELKQSVITDAGLAELQYYPELTTLVLEGIAITDEGLTNLKHLPKLSSLKITDCEITGSTIASLPNEKELMSIDLSRTHFGDDQCEQLRLFSKLDEVTLEQTDVTGRCLQSLAALPELNSLNLSDTRLVSDDFPTMLAIRHLHLDNTMANDALVVSLAKNSTLWNVSLRNTKITNKAVAALSKLPELYHIDLSDTQIDDEAAASLGNAKDLSSVDLSGTQVTGFGFADWNFKSRSFDLILDRAPVTDEGVKHLAALNEFDQLSLAKTQITDACLQHLVQVGIEDLDLCHTRVTFNGLLTNGLPSIADLYIESGRFTETQISQLEKKLGIDVHVAKDRDE